MLKSKVLIIGLDSQNGIYLSNYLKNFSKSKNLRVFGTSRNLKACHNNLVEKVYFLDLNHPKQLKIILKDVEPDFIFIYAGKTSSLTVNKNFQEHLSLNFLPVSHVLNWIYEKKNNCKLFYASSAERFGNTDLSCDEDSICVPTTFYGVTKLLADKLVTFFRKKHGLFCVNGYFYNNESYLRDESYFSKRIILNALKVKAKKLNRLEVFNPENVRDWSHTFDFASAAWHVLNLNEPEDYIFSSGKGYSVKEFASICLQKLDLNPEEIIIYPKKTDSKVSQTTSIRLGNNKKLISTGWVPKFNLYSLCEDLISKSI